MLQDLLYRCYKKLLNCMAYTRHAVLSLLWSLMDRKLLLLRRVSNQANPFFRLHIYGVWYTYYDGFFGWYGHLAFVEWWQGNNYLRFLFAPLPTHVVATGKMAREREGLLGSLERRSYPGNVASCWNERG